MKVYITTDLEGVAGVLLDEQVGGNSAEYQKARRLLTHEVNAVVEGLVAGGATEIIVDDAHSSGFNFIFEELHPTARYIMGSPRPQWPPELDASVEATLFIGCHAMAGTRGAVRDHTMSTVAWHNMWINGRLMGEIGLWAAMAGYYGVPCVMMSGCEKACAEATLLVPGISTVATKRGLSRYAAVLEPVEKVQHMLRAEAKTALTKAKTITPIKVSEPVEIRVEYNNTGHADGVRIIPGRERIDARTIAYHGATLLEAAAYLL